MKCFNTKNYKLFFLYFICAFNHYNTYSNNSKDTAQVNFSKFIVSENTTIYSPKSITLQSDVLFQGMNHKNSTLQNAFGLTYFLDYNLALTYGVNSKCNIGLSKTYSNNLMSIFFKWIFLEKKNFPVTIGLYSEATCSMLSYNDIYYNTIQPTPNFLHRLQYNNQLMISKQIQNFSIQLSTIYIYRNFITQRINLNNNVFETNALFSLSAFMQYQLNSTNLCFIEFTQNLSPFQFNNPEIFHNLIGIGWATQIKGYHFKIALSNNSSINPIIALPNINDRWYSGQFKIGISVLKSFN